MSKKKTINKQETKDEQDQKDQKIPSMPVTIHAQYVRDISFENPNAIQALKSGQTAPKMDINFTMDSSPLEDNDLKDMHEVSLIISATAKRGEETAFIAEVEYGVVVSLGAQVPEDRYQALLLIEVPRLVFPFARQIIAELTVHGGYPPLLLNPVNFHQLYVNRFGAPPPPPQQQDAPSNEGRIQTAK